MARRHPERGTFARETWPPAAAVPLADVQAFQREVGVRLGTAGNAAGPVLWDIWESAVPVQQPAPAVPPPPAKQHDICRCVCVQCQSNRARLAHLTRRETMHGIGFEEARGAAIFGTAPVEWGRR